MVRIEATGGFDHQTHFTLADSILNERKTDPTKFNAQLSDWGGRIDGTRLHISNETPGGWVDGHRRFMENVAVYTSEHPEIGEIDVIDEIGVAEGAHLALNYLDCFPGLNLLRLYERIPERVNGACETLARRIADMGKSSAILTKAYTGNIVEQSPRDGRAKLSSAQLFYQHLVDGEENIPLWVPGNERDTYPTLERALSAQIDSVSSGGIVAVADLEMTGWRVETMPGYEDDPEVGELLLANNAFIHGRALPLGWQVRGAHPWKSEEELRQTILDRSQGQLKHIPELSASLTIDDPELQPRMNVLSAFIALTVASAAQTSLQLYEMALAQQPENEKLAAVVPRLRGAVELLWNGVEVHVQAMKDYNRFRVTVPPMHWLAFQKV